MAAGNTEQEAEDNKMNNDGAGENNDVVGEDDLEIETETEPAVVCKHPDNMYMPVRSVLSAGQVPMKLNPRMKLNSGQDPGLWFRETREFCEMPTCAAWKRNASARHLLTLYPAGATPA